MSAKETGKSKPARRSGRRRSGATRHPGDLSPEDLVARVIRVDHAGGGGGQGLSELASEAACG